MGVRQAFLYAALSKAFSDAGVDTIITNFADVFGLVCTGLGASSLASGPSQNLRRLSMSGFEDEGGGKALPHLYSHKCIAELASESDLNSLRNKKLLRRVSDITPYGETLLTELSRGGSAATIPAWTESQSNVTASQKHFIHRLGAEQRSLSKVSAAAKPDALRDWLETAATNRLYIANKLGSGTSLRGRFAPADDWLTILDLLSVISEFGSV
jgi:hypothetical protein